MKKALLLLLTLPLLLTFIITGCKREPVLHLYDGGEIDFDLPIIDLNLEVYWNYETTYEVDYDWRKEWYYGWDDIDRQIFGEIGYTEPTVFCLRRYFTGQTPLAPHTSVLAHTINGTHFRGKYNWGFWDLLVWNNIITLDGVQSLIFDEESSLDSVIAFTNQSMNVARYQAPKYTHSFYEPEALFAGYDQAIEVNKNLEGFIYDPEQNIYTKELNMQLQPITYIYLTQVILHHNNNRITAVDGSSNLSGMARYVNVNAGRAGNDPITVYYKVRMKKGCDKEGENVDIVGGRLMTFGICSHQANNISRSEEVNDPYRHYMDVTMQFNNGMDSTFVFDVTSQVRRRYKGGVITVELDMDTIPIPTRSGGSGFNAVVEDPDSVTHIIDI